VNKVELDRQSLEAFLELLRQRQASLAGMAQQVLGAVEWERGTLNGRLLEVKWLVSVLESKLSEMKERE